MKLCKIKKIEINDDFKKALNLLEETNKNVFITGRAGTGKSTLLELFRGKTGKKVSVLAPTGVAAVNIQGQTIHSFFNFKPDITLEGIKRKYKKDDKKNIYTKIDTIVIDEISMVRADLLDCVDKYLRLNGTDMNKPFGGIQMAFFGDLYQLPPVVTSKEKSIFSNFYESPYFFSSRVFNGLEIEFIELEKIYRQSDDKFIAILNAVRNNSASDDDIRALNVRYNPDFQPSNEAFYIYLTSTNGMADRINNECLSRLSGKSYELNGEIDGEFGNEYLPTVKNLVMKKGAQIMLLNNDSMGRWVNGTIGNVIDFDKNDNGEYGVIVRLENGSDEVVFPHKWEIFKYFVENENLKSEVIGSFTQYPIRLSWAVTIHKSQGKTFDRVVLDIGNGTFAHGQLYVALSRCTSLNGLILKKPLAKKHILMDREVVKFLTNFQYGKSDEACPLELKLSILRGAVIDCRKIKIAYLKPDNEKIERIITPIEVGEMEYMGVKFLGMKAFWHDIMEDRVFRIDRILDIQQYPD